VIRSNALILARSRRSVVVIDSGSPRNAPAKAVHGLIALDGTPPSETANAGGQPLSMVEDQHLSHVAPLVLRCPGGAAARVWTAALTSTGLGRTGPGRWSLFGEAADFEGGDSPVSEAKVRAGGLQPLVESEW
jgi:hypothetical protein